MPSPFPGVDPYLEAHWHDVRARMIVYAAEVLERRLPSDLHARLEERVFVESPGDEPITETFLEIREARGGNAVVTVLEILSPSNKAPGEGQRVYRRKQDDLRRSAVNLVEIDLLRGGERILLASRAPVPASHRTPYQISVRRATTPDAVELYRVPLEEPLPVIGVPLRATDADIPLELQALLDRAYESGAYDDLDYGAPPDPPLDAAGAAWADALLRAAGRR